MLYDWVQNQHCPSFAFKVEAFVLYFRLKPFWPLLKYIFHLFRAHWCALKKKRMTLDWQIPLRVRNTEAFCMWWELSIHQNVWRGQDSVSSQRWPLWLCDFMFNGLTVVIFTLLKPGNFAQSYSKREPVPVGVSTAPPHCPWLFEYQTTSWSSSSESVQWEDKGHKRDF